MCTKIQRIKGVNRFVDIIGSPEAAAWAGGTVKFRYKHLSPDSRLGIGLQAQGGGLVKTHL